MCQAQEGRRAVFVHTAAGFGFPLAVPVGDLAEIEATLTAGRRSLQALAASLRARRLRPHGSLAGQLFNVNTREELQSLRRHLRGRVGSRSERKRKNIVPRL
jgi:hypothetical protein